MYESLPLGEVDSRVGHIARHKKDKAKNTDGTDQEQEDSEVPPGPSHTCMHSPADVSSARCLSRAPDHEVWPGLCADS